eukprot:m.54678 g.54678  ORF g.54678 m.54678 type:complete len:68 (+) comp13639_c0_seq3:482-685(+)
MPTPMLLGASTTSRCVAVVFACLLARVGIPLSLDGLVYSTTQQRYIGTGYGSSSEQHWPSHLAQLPL